MLETPGPGAPERLRSMLVAAASLALHTPGHRADLVGRHGFDEAGRLTVELPRESCLTRHLLHDGELVATVEVTDLAPIPLRDRVRARAVLTGWLIPVDAATADPGEVAAVLELAGAELHDRSGVTQVDPDEFGAARPDPLAGAEADLLCHLAEGHPETVERLSRLVPPRQLDGVRRIHPVRLDRFGVVLRLEFASRDRDVRLPFATPLETPDQTAVRMSQLLATVGRCRRPIRS